MGGFVPQEPDPNDVDTVRSGGAPEDELDALLTKVEEKRATKEEQAEPQQDAIDVFRSRMRLIYIPVFENLVEKYAEKGIELSLDADEFMGGSSSMKISMRYGEISLVLDGTAMRGGIAFYLTRSVGNNAGAVVSGPLLRIRNLSADDFRQFVVSNLSTLVKDALRQV